MFHRWLMKAGYNSIMTFCKGWLDVIWREKHVAEETGLFINLMSFESYMRKLSPCLLTKQRFIMRRKREAEGTGIKSMWKSVSSSKFGFMVITLILLPVISRGLQREARAISLQATLLKQPTQLMQKEARVWIRHIWHDRHWQGSRTRHLRAARSQQSVRRTVRTLSVA